VTVSTLTKTRRGRGADAMLSWDDMLAAYRTKLGQAKLSLGVAASALLALATSGCGSTLSGEQDAKFNFKVLGAPASNTFSAWTDITVDGNINSVGPATLLAVTLALDTPSPVTDLSFLSTLEGQAVTATTKTTVATLTTPTRGEQKVSLHIDYFGDLHPLFESTSTIHITWTGDTNPAFTAWPADGIELQGEVEINIQ
jgi:hypothetical protein